MKRRQLITTTAIAGLMLAMTGILFAATDSSIKPLNVVMIEVDDLNYKNLGYMGHPVAITPHLDKLAAQGTVFKNCIVQGTACAPSRNSLLTGTYPHNTGIYENQSRAGLPEGQWTFPNALERAGVYTSFYGKNHFRTFGLDPRADYREKNKHIGEHLGFTHTFSTGGKVAVSARLHPASWDPYSEYLTRKGTYQRLVDAYANKRGQMIDFPLDEEDYLDAFIINSSLDWLGSFQETEEAARKPCFLWVDLTLPHPPMDTPAKYFELYKDVELPSTIPVRKDGLPESLTVEMRAKDLDEYHRGYLAMISMLDAQVGKVTGFLDQSGLRENTIIIFFSDHGSMIGHHGLMAKKYFYKDVVNSPLIISHPEFGQGKVINRCVELLDLSQTMLSLYGCQEGDVARSHGEDLMPLLSGEGTYERKFAHAEQKDVNMIQNASYKLISYPEGDILFDLKNDPDELTNVFKDFPGIARNLRRKKLEWLANSGEIKPADRKPDVKSR
jgi:arylsulfatase A-like enzyme